MELTKPVGLACDHAGYPLKKFVQQYLEEHGIQYTDFGTYSDQSCNYPEFAHALARAVEAGEVYPGIAICGTGEGMAMTLNKYPGLRAGLCWDPEIAQLTRQHNDANVLVMPGRFVTNHVAARIMDQFFSTPFEGGRHQVRVKMIPIAAGEQK